MQTKWHKVTEINTHKAKQRQQHVLVGVEAGLLSFYRSSKGKLPFEHKHADSGGQAVIFTGRAVCKIHFVLDTINRRWRWIFDSCYSLTLSIQLLPQLQGVSSLLSQQHRLTMKDDHCLVLPAANRNIIMARSEIDAHQLYGQFALRINCIWQRNGCQRSTKEIDLLYISYNLSSLVITILTLFQQ